MIVADSPMTLAKERSNSPTMKVQSPATARNSNADWDPKMACAVETLRNLSGMITAYVAAMTSQTPISA